MAKKTVRIRQRREIEIGGFCRYGTAREVRVIDVPEDQVPDGSEVVADGTDLHDWQDEK